MSGLSIKNRVTKLTLEGFVRLEHFDQLDGSQDIRVFSSDLDDDLEVLTDIDPEHFLQTRHRLFCRETAKVADQPLKKYEASINI